MFDVTKFDLDKFLCPIWQGEVSYAEAAFVRESEQGGIEPIELLYPIDEIISVRNDDIGAYLLYDGGGYFVRPLSPKYTKNPFGRLFKKR